MLREFAVEPALLGRDWETFRYLHEKFGISKARVIAKFPKKWCRLVYEEASDFPDARKKQVEEWLHSGENTFLIPSGRTYGEKDDWLQNAVDAHNSKPFNSILARDNPCGCPAVLKWSDDVTEDHKLLKSDSVFRMPKTIEEFLETCYLLLQHSHEIIFVDPYLKDGNGSFEVLKSLLYSSQSIENKKNIRYLTIESPNGETLEYRVNELNKKLPKLIPTGMSIKIILLNEENCGRAMHNRYILTERGGIIFPWGLDLDKGGASDEVIYLNETVHCELFNEYDKLKGYTIDVSGRYEDKRKPVNEHICSK